jgi:RNA polymerase sigma factor (sigma-70 family)
MRGFWRAASVDVTRVGVLQYLSGRIADLYTGSPAIYMNGSDVVIPGAAERTADIEALSRRFRIPLARYFEKRIGRQAEIDDLVQEVFLHLAGGGRVECVERPEAYLFKTAANVLNDRWRRLTARAADSHEPYDEEVHGSARETLCPERALLGAQAVEQLVAALHELPERMRVVWALYHLEDLTHAEIGRRLGITVSAIEKHIGRANGHLLKKLDFFA